MEEPIKTRFNTEVCWEAGGGEQVAIEEENASLGEIYAAMIARGALGPAVAHAAGGTMTNQTQALAMMKNAMKAPKYMEPVERALHLQTLDKQVFELDQLNSLDSTKENKKEDKNEPNSTN